MMENIPQKKMSEKQWKKEWGLKSMSFDELWTIVRTVVTKQLEDLGIEDIKLESNFTEDYEADSVDIVAMLLYLEEIFKNASSTTKTVVPTDKLGKILLVEDLFDVIYEVLTEIEGKMENFTPIKADLHALEKREKVGNLYSK